MTEWEDAQHAAQNVLIRACEHPGFMLVVGRGWRCRRCDGAVAVLLRPRLATPKEEELIRALYGTRRPDGDGPGLKPPSAETTGAPHGSTNRTPLGAGSEPAESHQPVGPSRAGAPHEEETAQADASSSERSVQRQGDASLVHAVPEMDSDRGVVGPLRVPGLDPLAEVEQALRDFQQIAPFSVDLASIGRGKGLASLIGYSDALHVLLQLRDRLRPASPAPEESTMEELHDNQ